jgi:hypothetical protein
VFFANEKLFNSLFFKIKPIIHPRFGPTLALPGGEGTQFPPVKSNLKKYISMLIDFQYTKTLIIHPTSNPAMLI